MALIRNGVRAVANKHYTMWFWYGWLTIRFLYTRDRKRVDDDITA